MSMSVYCLFSLYLASTSLLPSSGILKQTWCMKMNKKYNETIKLSFTMYHLNCTVPSCLKQPVGFTPALYILKAQRGKWIEDVLYFQFGNVAIMVLF